MRRKSQGMGVFSNLTKEQAVRMSELSKKDCKVI